MLELPWQARHLEVTWSKAGVTRSAGTSLSGVTQVVGSGSGFWRASVEVLIRGSAAALAWKGFYASLEGMATPFLMPAYGRWRPTDREGLSVGFNRVGGYGDGRANHNHTGFAVEEPVLATVAEDAFLRGTRLTVEHTGTEGLRPGHFFGLGGRLYQVAGAWSIEHADRVQTGGQITVSGEAIEHGSEPVTFGIGPSRLTGRDVQIVEFWPHLRADAETGAPLRLTRPWCPVRLASDDMGALGDGAGSVQRRLSFEVVEYI